MTNNYIKTVSRVLHGVRIRATQELFFFDSSSVESTYDALRRARESRSSYEHYDLIAYEETPTTKKERIPCVGYSRRG